MPHRPCNLLLVDDAENDQLLFRIACRGASPHSFRLLPPRSSGAGAIRYLSGQDEFGDRARFPYPDLLVLDLKMPFKGGFDVLEWIAGQPSKPLVYVLTDSTNKRDREKAMMLGATDYFIKPAGMPELTELIEHLDRTWKLSTGEDPPRSPRRLPPR
jgi:DNA-binding response OmpR family regulator